MIVPSAMQCDNHQLNFAIFMTHSFAMLSQQRFLSSSVLHGVGCRTSSALCGRRGGCTELSARSPQYRNAHRVRSLEVLAQQTTLPRQEQQKTMSSSRSVGSNGSVDPRSKHFWTTRDMPPQDGKVVIVTGASSGMGWYCAQALAEHGAHVIIAARSLERCQSAASLIKVLHCILSRKKSFG